MKCGLICGGLVAVLAYYAMNVTMPEGCAAPWKVRLTDVIMQPIFFITRDVIGAINLPTGVSTLRMIFDGLSRMKAGSDPLLKIRDTNFDGVPVRVYTPVESKDLLPGFVYYHGGGWEFGSRDTVEMICREISKRVNAVVVSVEYRMAPEVTFPIPFEDGLRATKHFLTHAEKLGVDPTRVGIGGDSAGGNMAAAVSLKLRDKKFEPKVKQQVLIYPAVQSVDFHTPSYQQNAFAPMLKATHMHYYTSMHLTGNKSLMKVIESNRHVSKDVQEAVRASYIDYAWLPKEFREQSPYEDQGVVEGDAEVWNSIKDAVMSPYMSPLLAKNLGDLPDAYVITCGYDVLRDEGYLYAQRMKEFGTKVKYVNYENTFHGVLNSFDIIEEGGQMLDGIIAYLEKEL
ncbi:hypothetical protein CAPTEDRAFT_221251 [Capitella teleta]|uniref:Alpha/beta hydrolase fold-3 domain-containing protein n=1 Tax=Capitella teleta TaxID=283909 RepID=R7UE07_CAPTE|nr:hypothetical protein CAPTEDRAFT_221251 [Capitella teleta]|eukprot:ELU02008.1 hypothetical protein CAPTEDRAFT_221251 [Capitella teleta]